MRRTTLWILGLTSMLLLAAGQTGVWAQSAELKNDQNDSEVVIPDEQQFEKHHDNCRKGMARIKDGATEGINPAGILESCRLVASSGHVETQAMLGATYMTGGIVEKNEGEGLKWFRLAAKQGHVIAQYHMIGAHLRKMSARNEYPQVVDEALAYGWLCVLEKQVNTPGSPGLELWHNPAEKYKDNLRLIKEAMEMQIRKHPIRKGWGMKKMCKSSLQTDYVPFEEAKK